MGKLSNLISLYVKRRPFLYEVLRQGIINYSALARKICYELNIENEDTVKMALIRLSKKLEKGEMEEQILQILKESTLTIKNKVAVIISSKKIDSINYISLTKSGRYYTYIVNESDLVETGKIEKNLNLIIIQSPEEVEEISGVISYILNSLSDEGINVIEFISCYTDTILVIKQSDTKRAYEILTDLMD